MAEQHLHNPIAFRKVKIVYNFGLSECNRVKMYQLTIMSLQHKGINQEISYWPNYKWTKCNWANTKFLNENFNNYLLSLILAQF